MRKRERKPLEEDLFLRRRRKERKKIQALYLTKQRIK
jgi:hypothetical protein